MSGLLCTLPFQFSFFALSPTVTELSIAPARWFGILFHPVSLNLCSTY
jgi:hypothetical protein